MPTLPAAWRIHPIFPVNQIHRHWLGQHVHSKPIGPVQIKLKILFHFYSTQYYYEPWWLYLYLSVFKQNRVFTQNKVYHIWIYKFLKPEQDKLQRRFFVFSRLSIRIAAFSFALVSKFNDSVRPSFVTPWWASVISKSLHAASSRLENWFNRC